MRTIATQTRFSPETFNFTGAAVVLTAKAAQTRKLSLYCLHLCEKFKSHTHHDLVRYTCAWGWHEYNMVVKHSGEFMEPDQISKIVFVTRACLDSYYWLRNEAVSLKRMKRFRPKPKNHQWIHLVEDFVATTRRNPRSAWCYCDEDFVGRMKVLMQKAARVKVSLRTMQKYLLSWAIKLGELRDGRLINE